jgi:hypothetical protein|tara:strand:- start:42 stop:677 length:636 start_codon:yes stop_codon:yes gene_type:complete
MGAYFEGATIDDIYETLAYTETGTHPLAKDNPFARTYKEGSKSSAYGPVQMTGGEDSMIAYQLRNLGKTSIDWTDEEIKYMTKFKDQASQFLKYGGGDWKKLIKSEVNLGGTLTEAEAKAFSEKYEYGKSGTLTSDKDKIMYEQVAKKLIKDVLKSAGGVKSMKEFKRLWRGNRSDTDYFQKFDTKLRNILDERATTSMFPDENLMENMLA